MENKSVFDTVKMLMEEGLSFDEAVEECEKKLRVPLPMDIKDRIRVEVNYGMV